MHWQLPELTGDFASTIRIPAELDVRVTRRVLSLIDTPPMQRLKRISQLGLVSHVYPGACHSRLEHSLGVYRLARELLKHLLAVEPDFADSLTEREAKIFLVAALLHDVGHWPYCHAIEDMRLDWVPHHEHMAIEHLSAPEIAGCLCDAWDLTPQEVADFLTGRAASSAIQVLQNVLNGPVDIDKMDYLQRDSLHAGVPYGRNFDLGRLVSSVCIDGASHRLAITDKGKTAAEMMVFSRYVMFSEVYWHHAVRSATAMLQRLVYSLADRCSTDQWLHQTDADFAQQMLDLGLGDSELCGLAAGLFGPQRLLYKRVAQFSFSENADVHAAIAHRSYAELVHCAEELSKRLSADLATPLLPTDILIDAPPKKREVQFQLSIRTRSPHPTPSYVPLGDRSPVVRALATEQFDNFVKQVRVFVAPHRAAEIRISPDALGSQLVSIAGRL